MEIKDLAKKVEQGSLKVMRTMCQENGRVILILHPTGLPESGITVVDCSDLPEPVKTKVETKTRPEVTSNEIKTKNEPTKEEDLPFKCPICGKGIPSERGYKIHMSRMHKGVPMTQL